MTVSLLYCGVDTLEATFEGELEEGRVEDLQKAKDRAQIADSAEPYMIGDSELFVSAKGVGVYRFALSDADLQLRVSVAKRGIPPVSVRLFASALAANGHAALYAKAVRLAAELGANIENTLSRIDLCLDVQGWEFSDIDFANLVCPASFRQVTRDGEGVCYQIGKGDVVLRIYRKDEEIKANKNLAYAKLWEKSPGYDPSLPVWRIEVQLRGSALKELNARSIPLAFTKLPKLFFYGMTWCELRVPADANKTRWPLDPAWGALRGLWGASEPEPRIRTTSRSESEEQIVARLTGALASLGAYCPQDDLLSVMKYSLVVIEQRMADRGIKFSDLVEEKRVRQIAEQGVPF